jgi:formyltetrahydrofolate deformylase
MSAVLLLSCPDQRGVVAATTSFVAEHDGNIIHAEQHVDTDPGGRPQLFQRVEFELDGFGAARDDIAAAFAPVAERFGMHVDVRFTDRPTPTVIMASKATHCLHDLLSRWASGELPMDLRSVVSNHPDHEGICTHLGLPYVHLPVNGPEDRDDQEGALVAHLDAVGAELIVMARYMRILSNDVVGRYPNRIINIHHSFLPAFIGANPYRQAHDRGVKLIGATAHYATADLDEGPIIEQETARVSHRDDVARLTARGRDLETIVLARAVQAHLEHRVLVSGTKTVVFS